LFLQVKSAIISVQMRFRRRKSLKLAQLVRNNLHAVQLQKYLRRLSCQFRFKKFRFAVVVLQNLLRKRLAKEKLKSLRLAAKDVGKLRQSNDALKLEIESLKARAVEETRRLRVEMERQVLAQSAQTQVDDLNALRAELQDTRQLLEIERKLRQDAEWAFAASEEKLSSCELRLALVLRNVSEEDGDQMSVQRAESKLILSEHALQNATRVTGPNHSTGTSGKIGSPTISTSPLHSPGVGSALSSPSSVSQRKKVSAAIHQSTSIDRSSPTTTRSQVQLNAVSPDSFALIAAADEKYREAIDALEKEAYARQVLEEEVSRLRQLSMEYKAQVDSLKRSTVSSNNSVTTTTVASAVSNARRITSTPNVLDPRRRASQAASSPAPVIQHVAEEPAQWGKAWDDEDSSSNGDTAIASPRSSISDGSSIHGNNPLIAAVAGAGQAGVSVSATSHQSSEITSAVSTFERNLDLFRNKLKQVIS
jgi:hypothetical protein